MSRELLSSGIFFFNDTATTEIYTLSLHDALPIWPVCRAHPRCGCTSPPPDAERRPGIAEAAGPDRTHGRSEEHTSELQSRQYLVCRLLLEKKNNRKPPHAPQICTHVAARYHTG